MTSLWTLLQISRPGWWIVNLWLYLAPTAQRWDLFYSPMFWFGIVYVTLPLNLLVFGLNDLSDLDIDKDNPRKGNFVFGAKCAKAELVGAMKFILWSNLACLFFILFTIDAPGYFFAVFCIGLGANIAYNFEPFRLSSKCPFEFLCVISGFFVTSLVSSLLNDLPVAPAKYWLHTACRIIRHQLWTEYMDIEADGAKQRRTTAVVLGKKLTLCAVTASNVAEVILSFLLFDDFLLCAYSTVRLLIFLGTQLRPILGKSENHSSSTSEDSVSSETEVTKKAKKNSLMHDHQKSTRWLFCWPGKILLTGTEKRGEISVLIRWREEFWFGLFYVLFPLNLVVFGFNDLSDVEVDKDNPRKGNFIFGSKLPKKVLVDAMKTTCWIGGACLAFILCNVNAPGYFLAIFIVSHAVNVVYNFEPFRFSSKSPLEFPTVIFGFSCVTLISCAINNLPLPPARYWMHLAALCTRVELWTEYMDIIPDGAKKRRTTAVVLGKNMAKCAVGVALIVESVIAYTMFDSLHLFAFAIASIAIFVFATVVPDMKEKSDVSSHADDTACTSKTELRDINTPGIGVHVIMTSLGICLMWNLWLSGVFVS